MAQQARKQAQHQGSRKATVELAEVAQNAEKKVLEMGREGVEEMLREADTMGRVARDCMGICTDALSASVESGSAASHTLREMNSQIMENVNRAFSENAELFKEAFACRTINDVAKWREHAWQKTMDRYFDEANAMMETLFDGCGKVMEPLQEQTSNASDQIRKAMAE